MVGKVLIVMLRHHLAIEILRHRSVGKSKVTLDCICSHSICLIGLERYLKWNQVAVLGSSMDWMIVWMVELVRGMLHKFSCVILPAVLCPLSLPGANLLHHHRLADS